MVLAEAAKGDFGCWWPFHDNLEVPQQAWIHASPRLVGGAVNVREMTPDDSINGIQGQYAWKPTMSRSSNIDNLAGFCEIYWGWKFPC